MLEIKWFPPSWVQIKFNDSILYIDPAYLKTYYQNHPSKIEYSSWPDEIDGLPEKLHLAEIILLTHEHKDHCKKVTVDRLSNSKTAIFGPRECLTEIGDRLRILKSDEMIKFNKFQIITFPAYNTAKGSSIKIFHKKNSGLGYKITVNNNSIYHPGDTSLIPEMKKLGEIDLAFIPIDGKFTMNIEEAIQTALIISPKIVVPIHDMGKNDPKDFQKELEKISKIQVKILQIGEKLIL